MADRNQRYGLNRTYAPSMLGGIGPALAAGYEAHKQGVRDDKLEARADEEYEYQKGAREEDRAYERKTRDYSLRGQAARTEVAEGTVSSRIDAATSGARLKRAQVEIEEATKEAQISNARSTARINANNAAMSNLARMERNEKNQSEMAKLNREQIGLAWEMAQLDPKQTASVFANVVGMEFLTEHPEARWRRNEDTKAIEFYETNQDGIEVPIYDEVGQLAEMPAHGLDQNLALMRLRESGRANDKKSVKQIIVDDLVASGVVGDRAAAWRYLEEGGHPHEIAVERTIERLLKQQQNGVRTSIPTEDGEGVILKDASLAQLRYYAEISNEEAEEVREELNVNPWDAVREKQPAGQGAGAGDAIRQSRTPGTGKAQEVEERFEDSGALATGDRDKVQVLPNGDRYVLQPDGSYDLVSPASEPEAASEPPVRRSSRRGNRSAPEAVPEAAPMDAATQRAIAERERLMNNRGMSPSR